MLMESRLKCGTRDNIICLNMRKFMIFSLLMTRENKPTNAACVECLITKQKIPHKPKTRQIIK